MKDRLDEINRLLAERYGLEPITQEEIDNILSERPEEDLQATMESFSRLWQRITEEETNLTKT